MALTAAPTGPQAYRGEYAGTPMSATQARHDVEMILATWHMEQLILDARQVVAELMANAVGHCQQETVEMELLRTHDGVRIAVVDSCPKTPVMKEASPADENGRGMFLISVFADAWDWEFVKDRARSRRTGKRVWADLSL